VVLAGVSLGALGCSGEREDAQADDETSFLSHIPGSRGSDRDSAGGDGVLSPGSGNGSGGTSGAPEAPQDDGAGGGSPERAIAEADILRLDGTRLYALSRYSGLSVVDVGNPRALRLVGAHRAAAMPFEMYIEGARAYVMYNGWGTYKHQDDGSLRWAVTSRVQALDISDPAAIRVIGEHEVPGEISDSRKVGDVLYLVTYEDSYCWGCDTSANTRVSSFDVSDPARFTLVDQLRFQENDASWGRRSISVTPERIYVSGWSWSSAEPSAGAIDVVDISDPGGDLTQGAQLSVAGPIQSRWQMDEYDGVLRVISQPGGWGTGAPPVVETFQVDSSSSIQKLASLDVVLPRPEVLRSVRFDGARAYAITFEQTDPLFTFDLSVPSEPKQLGELEIPGWVYHMEPRGDRIYALGFDNTVEGGSLHVSLFDVSDMTNPQQLARVNFGGDWAQFAEDQDRIHKAFSILPESGLILVPYSGYSYSENECDWYGSFHSGIQLVDMTTETLELRGVAPQIGQARRALLVDENLLGISDNAVQTFDISDRDAPSALGRLDLARNVSHVRAMGSTLLRFGSDWWTRQTQLDFALNAKADQAEPLGELDLSSIELEEGEGCGQSAYWDNQVLVHGGYAYVPRRSYSWGSKANATEYTERLRLYIIDIGDRTNPTLVGSFLLETNGQDEHFTRVIKTASAILVGRSVGNYWSDPWTGYRSEVQLSYDVLSLENPAEPRLASTIALPKTVSAGGFGYGATGCAVDMGWGWWGGYSYYGNVEQAALVSGDLVVSQHEVPVLDGTGRVRYFLDRLDVSDPEHPVLLQPVNIPGGLVDFDAATNRIVTIDYRLQERRAVSWDECSDGMSYWEDGICRSYPRRLNTLRLDGDVARRIDQAPLDGPGAWASGVAASKTRVFFTAQQSWEAPAEIRAYAIGIDGRLEGLPAVETEAPGGWGTLFARGERAFYAANGAFTVVDTRDGRIPKSTTHDMGAYYCAALEVTATDAYCALGEFGVQAFPLE
jgi:hypothetical protein